mgnify:CR=1 FL=1|jgi:hypothetical protein
MKNYEDIANWNMFLVKANEDKYFVNDIGRAKYKILDVVTTGRTCIITYCYPGDFVKTIEFDNFCGNVNRYNDKANEIRFFMKDQLVDVLKSKDIGYAQHGTLMSYLIMTKACPDEIDGKFYRNGNEYTYKPVGWFDASRLSKDYNFALFVGEVIHTLEKACLKVISVVSEDRKQLIVKVVY